MAKAMNAEGGLPDVVSTQSVEQYQFEPIKGYPMLFWKGKRPFTSTHYYPAQLKERHGEDVDGWRNQLYWGDNLQVMSHLLKQYRGKINLVYIDPPFASDAEYRTKIQFRSAEIKNDQSPMESKQYTDIWTNDEYLQFMYERLILMRELLHENGSIFVECDRHKGHLIRCVLDEVFGAGVEDSGPGLVNEIIWFYPDSPGRPNDRFAPKHDTIYWYSKSGKYSFNADVVRVPILEASKKRYETPRYLINSQGKKFEYTGGDSSEKGKIPETVWQIPVVKGNSDESTSYPTQKPEALVRRLILAASKPDDIVFDCFMGSGTTQAVAMKLGRRFIGADINLSAMQVSTKRLLEDAEALTRKRQPELPDGRAPVALYTGFDVFTVNYYDVFRNPVEARELLLEALEVSKFPPGSLFDGERDGRMVKIMPVNRISTRAELAGLVAGLDLRAFEKRHKKSPNEPVEKITLVCMGHEPDLRASLEKEAEPYKLDVEVVDILRDRQDLLFRRDSEAKVVMTKGKLVIERFYPMNLLSKLSLQKEKVKDWRELVESVMIDWNYDGAVLTPTTVDIPEKDGMVDGGYPVPKDVGTIRVKITDLLSESLEVEVASG